MVRHTAYLFAIYEIIAKTDDLHHLQYPSERSIDSMEYSKDMGTTVNKLSILVPVYNERDTILILLKRLEEVALDVPREIIVVDDGSTDGTTQLLQEYEKESSIHFLYQSENRGKSHAVKLGLERATGDYILIQDADLEYAPSDIPALVGAVTEQTPVVYGSRNRERNAHSSELFYWGGICLTHLTNLLYKQSLTDVATCYKLFPKSIIQKPLQTNKFAVCYELTALISKQNIDIVEVPISYTPRSHKEGKKIQVWDGVEAVIALIRFRF